VSSSDCAGQRSDPRRDRHARVRPRLRRRRYSVGGGVTRALDRAGFKIVASGLRECVVAQADGDDQKANLEQMEKLFMSLA
jgi:hypothetical protein